MDKKLKERDFRLVPLEELKTARDGKTVYLNRYWLTYKGCAMFFKKPHLGRKRTTGNV